MLVFLLGDFFQLQKGIGEELTSVLGWSRASATSLLPSWDLNSGVGGSGGGDVSTRRFGERGGRTTAGTGKVYYFIRPMAMEQKRGHNKSRWAGVLKILMLFLGDFFELE